MSDLMSFLRLPFAIFLGLVATWYLAQQVTWYYMARELRWLNTVGRLELEASLSWKCYLANYAWRLPFRWSAKLSAQAATELWPWIQGDCPLVIARWDPASPFQKRYRLHNRFSLV